MTEAQSKNRPRIKSLPQWAGWMIVGAIVVASWLFGGFGPRVMPYVAVVCLTAFLLSLMVRSRVRANRWMGFSVLGFLPWLLFLALGLIGIFNPAYEAVMLPDGRALARIPFNTWLPTVVNPGHAILVLLMLAAVMATILTLLRTSYSRSLLRRQLTLLVFNAAAISVIGLVGKLLSGFDFFGLLPTTDTLPFGTFDYHNNWTAFAVPNLAVALGLIEYRWTRSDEGGRAPLGLLIAAGLLVAGVILSSSRSGLILMSVLAAFAFLRGAWWIRRRGNLKTGVGRSLRPYAFYLLFVVLGVGTILFAGRDIMRARWDYTQMQVEQISEGQRQESRLFLARDTARMAMERPVFGWGNGSWAYLFPSFAGPEFWVGKGETVREFPFAHDDWLQLLAENGWVGALAFLGVPAWLVFGFFRRGRPDSISVWVMVGVALVGVLACWDYPMGHPANQIQVAFLFSLAIAYAVLENRVRKVGDEE